MKEKSIPQNKTILEKIGIDNAAVQIWKNNGLEITFPMKVNKKYFKSEDGPIFVEAADKYVPHLSSQEIQLYTKFPEKFRDIFLRNAQFFFRFHTFLYTQIKKIAKLKTAEEKLVALLALMYLYLSAMDHHYYHYDRYLAYQDYPETPLGFWWTKLKKSYAKVFKEPIEGQRIPPSFLKLLTSDKGVLEQCKAQLSDVSWNELKIILKNIKIFESAQQKEQDIVSGYPVRENLLLKTGYGLWSGIVAIIKKHPSVVQPKYRPMILKLFTLHPIIATRELLLPQQLNAFQPNLEVELEKEINRWI